jgi:hypothetical protein
MIHTEKAVRTLQAVAITVSLALFLWSTGLTSLIHSVEAVSITSASDTLSNSEPSQGSQHVIAFTTENGLSIGQTIVLSFESGFDLTGLNIGDISLTINGNATSTASSPAAGTWGVATGTPTGQDVQFTTPTDYGVSSSSAIVLTIGSTTNTMIVNPSATSSYYIDVGGTMTDSGQVRVAIIDTVTVSASVNTSLTFTVSGVDAGADVNGSPTTTVATTSNVALPFGVLPVGSSRTLAQRLNVATNATNGYTVTVAQDGELQTSLGDTIDGFIDGAYTTTPSPWQPPSAQINDLDTYGHWGLTSTDGTTTRSSQFTSDTWVSGSTTPIVIMGHTGPSDGVEEGIGSSTIGYQIEISALQEAGTDYETTLRYIATPVF